MTATPLATPNCCVVVRIPAAAPARSGDLLTGRAWFPPVSESVTLRPSSSSWVVKALSSRDQPGGMETRYPLKLTIFAATGGIGRQLLEQAIAAGQDVTAVARNPQSLDGAAAGVVTADLASADVAALQPAVEGAGAVLSALGARTRADVGVAARGTEAITQAMRAAGVRRIIVVSAAPIGTVPSPGRPHPPRHDPGDGFIIRYLADPIVKRA